MNPGQPRAVTFGQIKCIVQSATAGRGGVDMNEDILDHLSLLRPQP